MTLSRSEKFSLAPENIPAIISTAGCLRGVTLMIMSPVIDVRCDGAPLQGQGAAILYDPVCAQFDEKIVGFGGLNCDDASAGCLARTDSSRGVLDHHAILRSESKQGSTLQIRFGIGLADR